ncbi:MAG: 1-deoxy-D-xylulose-5-phosphate reductoisomerase, partial [Bacteroidales bacterium]|nr:1-deoxy-D-xylulose-5-phosphate reductoisomerase [Bacteroidales bacterium]
ESINDVVQLDCVDVVLTAVVGFAGLRPTVKAIESGKTIALSNKETLVVGGEYISRLALEKRVAVLPVDSEHSAVFQCINGEYDNKIKTIYLTASGGPFRQMSREQMREVTLAQALKHPNWSMGPKVTIDSASMMNKGLEMIEARWLFGVEPENIKAVVHPQSIIHSMVEFEDGSLKAQLGVPDMRLPIQYALTYPERLPNSTQPFNPFEQGTLTFERADTERFPCLRLAYEAAERGGNLPAIMNAANEVAVQAFLEEKIRFTQIADIIEKAMSSFCFVQNAGLEDYFDTDRQVREELQKQL